MKVDTSQFGAGGPINVAERWATAVLKNHDLNAAWSLMAGELRFDYVRAWVDVNASHPMLSERDLGKLCDALSADDPTEDRLWGGFAVSLVGEILAKWNHINPDHCGFLTKPRPIDIDRELVLYVDKGTPDPVVIDGPEDEEVELNLPFVGFIMRHGDNGWLIEGFDLDGRFAGERLGA
jgi:hypothetical protein